MHGLARAGVVSSELQVNKSRRKPYCGGGRQVALLRPLRSWLMRWGRESLPGKTRIIGGKSQEHKGREAGPSPGKVVFESPGDSVGRQGGVRMQE